LGSHDSSVGIKTNYILDVSCSSRTDSCKVFYAKPSRISLGPTQPLIERTSVFFPWGKAAGLQNRPDLSSVPRVKWPGLESACLPPSNIGVKNVWKNISTPPTCLYDLNGGKFIIISLALVAFSHICEWEAS